MTYNPWVAAAKAAWSEVSSEDAKAFFKKTSVDHFYFATFAMLEMIYWTVEAGRTTRRFVDQWGTAPDGDAPVEAAIAGYLMPAMDLPPITTEAVVTNQQKLENNITQAIRGIYNVQEIFQVGDEPSGEARDQGIPSIPEGSLHPASEAGEVPSPEKAVRRRKPRAASGDTGKAKDPAAPGRVSRKKRGVSQE